MFAVSQALGHHCIWTKSFETQPPVHKLLYETSYFIFTNVGMQVDLYCIFLQCVVPNHYDELGFSVPVGYVGMIKFRDVK